MKNRSIGILILFLLVNYTAFSQAKHTFEVKGGNFVYDGKPIQIHSGEMHFARVPKPYWRHRLKMMKAMGLNTVATYVFWNNQETAPGVWDFKTDSRDVAEFVRTAQQEGLMVILRPGPYACAEWEFGGYPWWLQKNKDLVIRNNNKAFLDSCRVYINHLAEQVKNLQITHGGPIIMVQAENEFGSYVAQRKDIPLEQHKAYSMAIKQELVDAGFDVPLFTSDGSWLLEGGSIKGTLPTVNGEDNINKIHETVNKYHDNMGPYMVAEFYPGWLDHWGEDFVKVSTKEVVDQTDKYLKAGISFNYYMIHGGTNFGFTSGANYDENHDIQPDITSYDYDAPISEAGWETPKYDSLRKEIQAYTHEKLPPVPAPIKTIGIPAASFDASADLFSLISKMTPVENDNPMTFEDLNQGHGYVLYRRKFNQPISGKLVLNGLRDYALIYVSGKKVGELNRNTKTYTMDINIPFNSTLDILVENMGRINYGSQITQNFKGIISPVIIADQEITGNWKMYKLPMSSVPEIEKGKTGAVENHPAIYHAKFNLTEAGDTFVDMSKWGKGIVFVNGHNLGRYWKVGPQQTLYLPGCWLKKGENDITVFEQLNDVVHADINAVKVPVLNQLNTNQGK
ncbi:beta-galactosidase [Mucilaginibacter sp. X5P1]|uniref:beta-galactosidase n=1 Tax=Mucilaginibacter sp. X5P1 TaxID=2723088 RepID=UPI00161515D3|nr:beta-galactosidase [Mucilaginibacter sp. X5P1]MBB6140163.1 beta-galactosidase [Mucilaginibacter sp. X5P1]